MTEAELLSLESEIGRMKAELHIGEKCKLLIAQVRHLRTATVAKPTIEQVLAAQAFLNYVASDRHNVLQSKAVAAAESKALAVLDAYFAN